MQAPVLHLCVVVNKDKVSPIQRRWRGQSPLSALNKNGKQSFQAKFSAEPLHSVDRDMDR